jgi:hypothetical protein
MTRIIGAGGGGRGLYILRGAIIVGCALLAVLLAVVLLLGLVVNRDPAAEEVIQAFRDEGLEVGEVQSISRSEDRSLIPKTYEEQVSFTIPLSGERVKGRVFTFPSRETLDPVREYYEEFGSMFSSYVYVEGNVLVQIAGDVPENQAERYGEVLRET